MTTDSLAFAPTPTVLREALDLIAESGDAGGGAFDAAARRAALERYRALGRVRERVPARWRHEYHALDFGDLVWSTGRARVPALPRHVPGARPPGGGDPTDAPSLAVDNAGGIVHLGSTYLEPAAPHGDSRVTLAALADAIRATPERVRAVLGRIVRPSADRFVALATAFQNCGAYVAVPPGVAVDAPLHLIWASRPGEASAVFSHVVVRVGAGARVTIVERHVGSTESFVCGTVEVVLAPGAHLDYVVVQAADEGARVLLRRGAWVEAGARVGWHVADLGAALARTTIDAHLVGPRAEATLAALAFPRGFGHVDLAASFDHRASDTASRTIARSVATGRGQGRFRGTIRIRAGTHGAAAAMRDDALVLSRDAYHESIPALDVASSDVSAQHAATTGALDEEQLFYVQSRGVARGRAARMIALAFFEPAIARFPSEALRDEVRTALDVALDDVPETFAQ